MSNDTEVGRSTVNNPQYISITPLLRRLWLFPRDDNIPAVEIARGISHMFTGQLSPVQAGALLTCLHLNGLDRRADVLAECALAMREAALKVDHESLATVLVDKQGKKMKGHYYGGLCDIVGTGGDSHNTFNVSTTSSILGSAFLQIGKHGNHASTSKSGSADILSCALPIAPKLTNVTPHTICQIYRRSNYGFFLAPNFHPVMRHVTPIRKELGCPTIFNLLGPLINPVDRLIEAQVLGVARREIGPIFAEALKIQGAQKALVVCGEEELDEISCAGKTYCWRLSNSSLSPFSSIEEADTKIATKISAPKIGNHNTRIDHFTLTPSDFGLPFHPLGTVSSERKPEENAEILMKLLQNQLSGDDPILNFVLMNTSALLVISGICEADTSDLGKCDNGVVLTERGPGGGRWKEGVRRARWAIESGEAWRQWKNFVEVTKTAS